MRGVILGLFMSYYGKVTFHQHVLWLTRTETQDWSASKYYFLLVKTKFVGHNYITSPLSNYNEYFRSSVI